MDTSANDRPRAVEARARTVRDLLHTARYRIDFYQREYAWRERQVRELIDDLASRFLESYEPGHARGEVERYRSYFVGSIVISRKHGRRFIVDGQQRLTTLTLLLVHLHRLQKGRADPVAVLPLIYSEKYGKKSFNLDVPERSVVMERLLEGEPVDTDDESESVRSVAERYDDIADSLPEQVAGRALPYFVDWLLERVHVVEIEAFSGEDAYEIFETMNDRGLSLSLPEMLKGYVLAGIRDEDGQRKLNGLWRKHMGKLNEVGDEGDARFFKDWLRARHAETIRAGMKGAENRDYERIGTEFHRWIRDERERLGLTRPDAFHRFVERDLDFYARRTFEIRQAARSPRARRGWEAVHYNDARGFALQTQALLAALDPGDDEAEIQRKVALVADFLDIWLTRRAWNFRTVAYSSVQYTLFGLTKQIRGHDAASLSAFLLGELDRQQERFAREPHFGLRQRNHGQVRHILARLSHWVDVKCGLPSSFRDLASRGRAKPFDIEHIWPQRFERLKKWFSDSREFEEERNKLGGLILLPSTVNRSLGDRRFEGVRGKSHVYGASGQNLLARSLHPSAYENQPDFRRLQEVTGLPFKAYESFGPKELKERQELYIRIAEWVWNPSRLDLDGEKPPEPEPIDYAGARDGGRAGASSTRAAVDQGQARLDFWQELLVHAREVSDLHADTEAGRRHWISARSHGQEWNYVALQHETRAELYMNGTRDANKALFDALHADREAVEAEFGGKLRWQRLDDKRASRISFSVPGGWADPGAGPSPVAPAVDAMQRLYKALAPRVQAFSA